MGWLGIASHAEDDLKDIFRQGSLTLRDCD